MGRKKRRTRRINGAGTVSKLKGHRSKPFTVRAPAELQINGEYTRPLIGSYKTREEAEIALAMYKAKPFNIDERNITLNELFEVWIEEKKKTVKRKRSYEKYSKAYITHLSHLKNRAIRSIMYNELQNAVSKPVISTSKSLKTLLNGVYKLAMKNNIVDKDISQLLEINHTRAYSKKTFIFDRELIIKIRKYSNESNYERFKKIADMILIMLYTGMRFGEIRNIKKENIFLEENYMIGGIKTEAGIDRIIPIHPKIKDLIILYYNEFSEKDYLFSQSKSYRAFSEVTFVNNYLDFRKLLNFPHNRHSTRHTFITEFKKIGISESKLKKIVGHESSDVTDGVYTHYEPKDLLIEVKKLDYGD